MAPDLADSNTADELSDSLRGWRRWLESAIAVVIAALILGHGLGSAWVGSGYIDPVADYGTQDEIIYGSGAIHMAEGGDWLTPVFGGRFVLNKPPMVYWTGALAVRLFGVSAFALRLPSFLAGVSVCLLVFCWMRKSRPFAIALAAMLLVALNPTFHFSSRRLMTDALLTAWITGAVFVLYCDPCLRKSRSILGMGLLGAAAVMTKSIAGFLPLVVLVVYWRSGKKQWRPTLGRVVVTGMLTLAGAAGWHLYQYLVHREWFVAEYLTAQILQTGSEVPWQEAMSAQLAFYAGRIMRTDPVLVAFFIVGLICILVQWRRNRNDQESVSIKLLLIWGATGRWFWWDSVTNQCTICCLRFR